MFVEKTPAELEAMTAKELQSYYVSKIAFEKEETQRKLNTLKESVDKSASSETVKALEEALKEQGRVLKALKEEAISGSQVVTMEGAIKTLLAAHKEDFTKASKGKHEFSMTLKAAADMTNANVSGGVIPQPARLEGVNAIAERMPKTYDLIPKLRVTGKSVEWVYETAQDGTIDGTAEGNAKDQIDNDFVVSSVSLVKRAAYYKVSTEMLDDSSFMEGWLRNKLLVRLFLDVDNQCLKGNNTAPNLNGVLNQATAFAAGSFAGIVDNANEVDVLAVALNQIKIANHDVSGLTIEMHPTDVTKLKLVKLSATDKRYIDRLIQVGSTLTLDGTPIIENVNITVGTFLVGAFNKATIVEKDGIMLEVGLDGNDFTKNMRTILAEWRGQLFIQNNDRTAFVTGTFATAISALETP